MDDRAKADLIAVARDRARVLDLEWGFQTPHPAANLFRRLATALECSTSVTGVTANVIEGEHHDDVLKVGDTIRISVALLREIYEQGPLHTSVPARVVRLERGERNEVRIYLQHFPDSRQESHGQEDEGHETDARTQRIRLTRRSRHQRTPPSSTPPRLPQTRRRSMSSAPQAGRQRSRPRRGAFRARGAGAHDHPRAHRALSPGAPQVDADGAAQALHRARLPNPREAGPVSCTREDLRPATWHRTRAGLHLRMGEDTRRPG